MVGDIFLKQYRADTFLGRGSMGTVFLARHLTRPEVVVVKVMNREATADPNFKQLFDREIETLMLLKHPNIVGLLGFDYYEPKGPCVVMEFIPGVTLEALLARHKVLPVDQVDWLLIPLCRALQYGHARQIIHRDLKPANLMVTDPDTDHESIKVMDFGLAQLAVKPHISLAKLRGTNTVDICGTPIYLAPEGLRGDSVDHRADIYSVGIMLFELLTGVPPFNYNDTNAVLAAHVTEKPPRMAKVRPGIQVPAAVEAAVQRCLSKYPNERPQCGRELCQEFSRAMGFQLTDEEFPPQESLVDSSTHKALKPDPPVIPNDPRAMTQCFDAFMPEPIAVVKLRGFVQDVGGEILDSEPGEIRVRVGHQPLQPAKANAGGSMLGSWFGGRSLSTTPAPKTGINAIQMQIYMARKHNSSHSNHLELTVVMRPPDRLPMNNMLEFQARCERIIKDLKAYLMAG